MQKNSENYDRVLTSLLTFYNQLGQAISCSEEKKRYVARLIARVLAGKIKILLSFPTSEKRRQQLRQYDQKIKAEYPDIYNSNINRAVSFLRKSGYYMYYPASILLRHSAGSA